MTTRLILAYVEREGGRAALEEVLTGVGMLGRERELRDENRWFADELRVRLFEAAAETLDDPQVARRVGEAAMDLSVGQALKLTLRALGSPRLIYSNIVRANARLNRVHPMDLVALDSSRASIRTHLLPGRQRRRCDCDYNIGLLSCVPQVFGDPRAVVRHPRCILDGAGDCVFEITWGERARRPPLLLAGSASLGALLVGLSVWRPALLAAAAIALLLAVQVVRRRRGAVRERLRLLEAQVREEADAGELLMDSLQGVVSTLQLDEVLDRVTGHARAAVGGAEFTLLVDDGDSLAVRGSSNLGPEVGAALEQWVDRFELDSASPVLVDSVAEVPILRPLAGGSRPLLSLCLAPLLYAGEARGALVALSEAESAFMPRDAKRLQSYASHAAIALANAQLFEAQRELAIRDPLTALFNHRHFHEALEGELERCRRRGGEVGVVVLDLDDFKRVNDTSGHRVGDEVLRHVGQALRRSLGNELSFRIGGDEFALVLPATGIGGAEAAAEKATRVIAAIDGRTSVCAGAAAWPNDGPTKAALLGIADERLYECKRGRRRPGSDGSRRRSVARPGAEPVRLACANRIATRLAPLTDPEEIARTTVQELTESFDLYLAIVHRIEGEELRSLAWTGPLAERTDELARWRQPLASGINGRAASSGESVLVSDTHADPAYLGTRAEDSRSELATPIRVDGEIWGVLNLEHLEPGAFGFDDLLFAETIAAAVGAALRRGELYAGLDEAFKRTLAVLTDALEAKDPCTASHARGVAELCEAVARRLGAPPEEARTITYAALLHDIGKIGLPGHILNKPGPLSAEEFEQVKAHPGVGARMLERIPYFAGVHPLVHASHERWDGRGYPAGLAGERIPLGARIISVCDAFHAMRSDRPYRSAIGRDKAIAELRRYAGTQFDPSVVRALLGELSIRDELGAARDAGAGVAQGTDI